MRRFAYTYAQVAEVAGVSVGRVRSAVAAGDLDPSDLRSLFAYLYEALRRGEQAGMRREVDDAKGRASDYLRRR